ncbi:MAG: phosphatase PAP2 family protein [Saprospiraceae bacterium]|jgi:undecaprenyl-diphosphatase|nr:phosphatase PAP2 family protein [Saprospiraceae bacterium]MBK6477814.1 phosphatase PAP2 family protein [Saprospiraceae bacterium]MBK6816309.1 phosphatase PAP2 family protein [Saprospiraceae bacterium]MBK7438131.1 phosphatase PAP2 family protein [Saprospiraceae bacterium]MBP7800339.1 phosphatase PAP2 family protein [Saprospiraceae bacterium]
MDYFLQLDLRIFHLINQVWVHPYLDMILSFSRNQFVWTPLYAFLIGFFIFNFGTKGLYLCLFAIGLVILSNLISSELIKKNVRRTRPCNEVSLEQNRRLLVQCGTGYSFTSSHATNHFCFSVFIILAAASYLPRTRYLFLLWAAVIAYAQIYVGVHYPMDVIFGSLLGIFMGWIGAVFYKLLPFSK